VGCGSDDGITVSERVAVQSDTKNSEAPCGPACDDFACEICGSGDGITISERVAV